MQTKSRVIVAGNAMRIIARHSHNRKGTAKIYAAAS